MSAIKMKRDYQTKCYVWKVMDPAAVNGLKQVVLTHYRLVASFDARHYLRLSYVLQSW